MTTKLLAAYLYANLNKGLTLYDILENYCVENQITTDIDNELPNENDDHDLMIFSLLHLAAES